MYPKPCGKAYWPIWSLNKLNFWFPPPYEIGLSLAGLGWGVVGLYSSLRDTYTSNLSTLPGLEPLEKVVVVGGGAWIPF